MGVVLGWEPWNWDLWNPPLEPDDDDDCLGLMGRKLNDVPSVTREGEKEPKSIPSQTGAFSQPP